MTASQLRSAEHVRIIDIRKEPDDQQIPGSLRYEGEALVGWREAPFTRDEKLVIYCGSGNSCRRVAAAMRERGYDAVALEGGYKAWREAGLPTEPISEKRRV